MSEIIFTDSNFESEALVGDMPVLVDFFAVWCGPCRMQGPIVEELAKDFEGKAKIGKLNVDENPQTAQKYGVMSIPTIIIFKGGQAVQTLIGVQTKDGLAQELNKLM